MESELDRAEAAVRMAEAMVDCSLQQFEKAQSALADDRANLARAAAIVVKIRTGEALSEEDRSHLPPALSGKQLESMRFAADVMLKTIGIMARPSANQAN